MDWQKLFDVVLAVAGGLGAWVLKTVWSEVKDARKDHTTLADKLPETYARRDDVATAMNRVEELFRRMDDKLDKIADRRVS